MKTLAFLLLLCVYGSLSAQVTGNTDERHIVFRLKHVADNPASEAGIHWDKEKPESTVKLRGRSPLKYSIMLENDTTATLYQYEGSRLIFQDIVQHHGWPISYIEGKEIFSEFVITDFDKDGNEDLLCWIGTNVNGNKWTAIFLNDPVKKRLVRLMNDADDTDIWDYPQYNEKDKTIECELFSGVYGFQSNYTFRLENQIALPVYKEERDYTQVNSETGDGAVIRGFVGENGKWKQVSESE